MVCIFLCLLANEPLSPGNAERKRPHDEILTDETSESDGDDIRDFDFDNYDSNEDPDYEVSLRPCPNDCVLTFSQAKILTFPN